MNVGKIEQLTTTRSVKVVKKETNQLKAHLLNVRRNMIAALKDIETTLEALGVKVSKKV